jgi:sigma54-dependent transcription regulator
MTMTQRPHDLPLAWWANNLEELDAEIARLAVLCQADVLQPGVIQRVLQRDVSVCGSENPAAFAKLHDLLLTHLAIRKKAAELFGQSETAAIEAYVVERLKKRFGSLLPS